MSTDDLAFVQLSKKIKPAKGRLFPDRERRCSRAHEEELKKNMKVHAPGTAFSAMLEELTR